MKRPIFSLLLCFLVLLCTCRKSTKESVSAINRLTKMAGTRVWSGTCEHDCWLCAPHVFKKDSLTKAITITVLNDSLFVADLDSTLTYYFDHIDTQYKYYYFSNRHYDVFHEPHAYYYYYDADSIVYYSEFTNSGEAYTTELHTK